MTPVRLQDHEIAARLEALPGWARTGTDGMTITRTYSFDHYLAGVAFAAAVGTVCEGIGHHPDLFIGWRRVTVSFTTHDAGNALTENDFQAAAAVAHLGYPVGG
ncbi:MAG: 4a-hydroxytetrahydrobiopterin dehydratase [bacterium]|nr:4a-hydroxytetrahydrobiopterin dehydratase [bacterium]